MSNQLDTASVIFQRVVKLVEPFQFEPALGPAYLALGSTTLLCDKRDEAKYYLEESLRITRKTGNKRTESRVLGFLGLLAQKEGDTVGKVR